MCSISEVQDEIKKLKELLASNYFGDSNIDIIEAQIQVLEEDMSEEDIDNVWAYDDESLEANFHVRDGAQEACWWRDGVPMHDAPSKGWEELVKK